MTKLHEAVGKKLTKCLTAFSCYNKRNKASVFAKVDLCNFQMTNTKDSETNCSVLPNVTPVMHQAGCSADSI